MTILIYIIFVLNSYLDLKNEKQMFKIVDHFQTSIVELSCGTRRRYFRILKFTIFLAARIKLP